MAAKWAVNIQNDKPAPTCAEQPVAWDLAPRCSIRSLDNYTVPQSNELSAELVTPWQPGRLLMIKSHDFFNHAPSRKVQTNDIIRIHPKAVKVFVGARWIDRLRALPRKWRAHRAQCNKIEPRMNGDAAYFAVAGARPPLRGKVGNGVQDALWRTRRTKFWVQHVGLSICVWLCCNDGIDCIVHAESLMCTNAFAITILALPIGESFMNDKCDNTNKHQ
jgi:hypothetical protein